jgi:hypothetical protein
MTGVSSETRHGRAPEPSHCTGDISRVTRQHEFGGSTVIDEYNLSICRRYAIIPRAHQITVENYLRQGSNQQV